MESGMQRGKPSPGPVEIADAIARSLARSRPLVPSGATFPRCGDPDSYTKPFEFPPFYEATVPHETLQILKGDSWKSQAFCRGAGIQLGAATLIPKSNSKKKANDSYPYLFSQPMLNC